MIISRDTLPQNYFLISEKTLCSVQVIKQHGASILDSYGIVKQEGTVQTTDLIHNSHRCFHIKLH